MNQQQGMILVGASAVVFFLSRQVNPSQPTAAGPTKKGLTITENEALGWIINNKLAYPNLGVLPESVVMATIAVESNFDPNAVAPAGERGLMQVIFPSTWNDVLKRAKLPTDLNSFGAKDNILVGMHFLQLVRQEFLRDGFFTQATSPATQWALIDQGYNLGPAAVKKGKRNPPRQVKFLAAREKFQRAGLP